MTVPRTSRRMRLKLVFACLAFGLASLIPTASAQTVHKPNNPQNPVTEKTADGRLARTYEREQKLSFSYARSLKVTMPPVGDLTVEGWSRREISILAKIRVEGATEADLDTLTKFVGYVVNQDSMTWALISVGPKIKLDKKDKKLIEKGKLPASLARLPYRIDYVVRVPEYTDLEIEQNEGNLSLATLYGAVTFTLQRGKVSLAGLGGTVVGRVVLGEIAADFAGSSWRGGGIDLQMGGGNMVLRFPIPYSADIVLSASQPLDVQYPLTRDENEAPDAPVGNSIEARLGVGGGRFKFTTNLGKIQVVPINK